MAILASSYVATCVVCMAPGGNISFVATGTTAGGNIISVAVGDTADGNMISVTLIGTCFLVSISSVCDMHRHIIKIKVIQ